MDEMYSLFRWFGEWLAVIEWTHVINRGSALLFLLGLGFGMGRFSVDQKRGPGLHFRSGFFSVYRCVAVRANRVFLFRDGP